MVMNIHKQKKITCFLFFIIVSLQAVAQEAVRLKSIKKEIGKADKLLATEFAATKLIPAEILIMRQYECHDSPGFYSPEKMSADSFYISAYEVTNKQYRQFLEYVQDSILRKLMGYVKQGADGDEYNDLTKKFDMTQISKRMEKIDICPITPIDYFSSPLVITSNGSTHMRLWSFVYAYKAEKKRIVVPVIPDTASWKLGAAWYLKKPVVMDDFWRPSINNFPITGINVNQAKAYCHWKTQQLKNALGNSSNFDIIFSLPTKPQWEAAAVSGLLPDNNRQCLLENGNQSNTNTKNGINEAIGFRYVVSFKRKTE
jgi:formylglycine-generating enzyme required for sulfatase activity